MFNAAFEIVLRLSLLWMSQVMNLGRDFVCNPYGGRGIHEKVKLGGDTPMVKM